MPLLRCDAGMGCWQAARRLLPRLSDGTRMSVSVSRPPTVSVTEYRECWVIGSLLLRMKSLRGSCRRMTDDIRNSRINANKFDQRPSTAPTSTRSAPSLATSLFEAEFLTVSSTLPR